MRRALMKGTAIALAAFLAVCASARAEDNDDDDDNGWRDGHEWHHGWDHGYGQRHRDWGEPGYGAYRGHRYQRCYVTSQQIYDDWGDPHWRRVRVCR